LVVTTNKDAKKPQNSMQFRLKSNAMYFTLLKEHSQSHS
jgi:hypothetical protein